MRRGREQTLTAVRTWVLWFGGSTTGIVVSLACAAPRPPVQASPGNSQRGEVCEESPVHCRGPPCASVVGREREREEEGVEAVRLNTNRKVAHRAQLDGHVLEGLGCPVNNRDVCAMAWRWREENGGWGSEEGGREGERERERSEDGNLVICPD